MSAMIDTLGYLDEEHRQEQTSNPMKHSSVDA